MKKVILIGRPNVGKSSLFNRLAKQRIAITSEISGTTRDTNKTEIEIFDRNCLLIDSGGLDDSTEMFAKVQAKTLSEVQNCDIVLFMVDGKFMPSDDEKRLFHSFSRLKKPLALVINKVDSKKDEERSAEFIEFGAENFFNISVTHNAGVDELKSWIYKHLPVEISADSSENFDDFLENFSESGEVLEKNENFYENKPIKVGIIGRVNVGKSSLLNALVKESRAVVSDQAGTTIDPVNESYIFDDKIIEFVDTAGIRRRGKIEGIERYALNRTEKILEACDIALLVLDSSEPFSELDERIAGIAAKFELGVIIILNKWDKSEAEFDKIQRQIRDKFKFLAYAPIISVSALGGKRVHKIYPMILEVYKNFTQKIQTSKINEFLAAATTAHPVPHDRGKAVKIYYGAQIGFAPPKIALVMNRAILHFSYKRYLINQMRENFALTGVPVILLPRKRGAGTENESEK